MIRLVQEFGAHTGRQFSFEQVCIHLGRAPTNEVAFDPNVDLDASGVHCEIVLDAGAYYVIDQNSRNGTWVNGNRVNRQRLAPNDVIECGRGGPRVRIEFPSSQPAAVQHPATAIEAFNAGTAATAAIPAMAGPSGFPQGTFQPGASPFAVSTPPVGTPFGSPAPTAPRPFQGGPPQGAQYTAGRPSQAPPFNPMGAPQPGMSPQSPFAPQGAPQHGFGPAPANPGFGAAPANHGFGPPPGNPGYGAGPPMSGGPVPAQGPPPGHGPAPAHGGQGPGGMSPGAAVAARLPAGAQVGKRTMAMMIDAALVQAGARKNNTGLKVAITLTLLLVVSGIAGGGWLLWQQKEETDRLSESGHGGEGGAGQRITRANEATIYMLAAVQPGGMPQGFCTGFAVTPDLLATNAHCVDVAQEMITQRGRTIVALRNNGRGVQVPVQPVFRDPRFRNRALGIEGSGYDVGIMRAIQPLPVQVRLASYQQATQLQPGSQIYVYGFPGLTMNEISPVATITEGILNRMTDFFDRAADDPSLAQKIQHSAQTTSGSSGSPIFLASGEVIGINAGSLSDAEHQNIVDPNTGRSVSVEVSRSSNFKYGMRADLIRAAIQSVGENAP